MAQRSHDPPVLVTHLTLEMWVRGERGEAKGRGGCLAWSGVRFCHEKPRQHGPDFHLSVTGRPTFSIGSCEAQPRMGTTPPVISS